jgi:hypothetical protein
MARFKGFGKKEGNVISTRALQYLLPYYGTGQLPNYFIPCYLIVYVHYVAGPIIT